jgi:D-glycero-beta-D-manno-heptose 1-phosphate adenylyltransferase
MGLIVDREAFGALRDTLDESARIVFTNGCFDLLHLGHISLLNFARSLGDALVIGINSDASVAKLKGSGRPVVPQDERAAVLAAMPAVSFAIVFDELDPVETIKVVRPHVHVKGGDYRKEDMVETAVVEAQGGEVVLYPLVSGSSTSRLIEILRGRGDEAAQQDPQSQLARPDAASPSLKGPPYSEGTALNEPDIHARG